MNKAVVFGLGCLGILVLVVVVFGLAVIGGYNGLVRSSTGVDASWAQVQTQYQRRADLIPNLVRTVEELRVLKSTRPMCQRRANQPR